MDAELINLRRKGEDVFLLEVIRRQLDNAGLDYVVQRKKRRIRVPILTDKNVKVLQELGMERGMDSTQPHPVYALRHLVDQTIYLKQHPVHGAQYFFVGMRPAAFKRNPYLMEFMEPHELHIELHSLQPRKR